MYIPVLNFLKENAEQTKINFNNADEKRKQNPTYM